MAVLWGIGKADATKVNDEDSLATLRDVKQNICIILV